MPTSVTLPALQTKRLPRAVFHLLLGLCLTACEKQVLDPEISKLLNQMETAEKQLTDKDLEIKSSKDDPVAAASASEEKELLKSRLERIKAQLRAAGALEPEKTPVGAEPKKEH